MSRSNSSFVYAGTCRWMLTGFPLVQMCTCESTMSIVIVPFVKTVGSLPDITFCNEGGETVMFGPSSLITHFLLEYALVNFERR